MWNNLLGCFVDISNRDILYVWKYIKEHGHMCRVSTTFIVEVKKLSFNSL